MVTFTVGAGVFETDEVGCEAVLRVEGVETVDDEKCQGPVGGVVGRVVEEVEREASKDA